MRLPLTTLLFWSAVATAQADFDRPLPGRIELRDMPGDDTGGQEARALVDAPPEKVRGWIADVEFWPHRFRDVERTRVLDRGGGGTRVWVRSRIMRDVVLRVRVDPASVHEEALDSHVRASTRIFVTPTGDGRTDVIMQAHVRLTGLLGLVVPKGRIRDGARKKLTSDLADLQRLAAGSRPLAPEASGSP